MSFSLFCLSPVLYLGINFSQTSFSPISPTSPNPLPLKCTTGNCANALHQVKEGAGTRYALSGSTGGKRIGENKRRETPGFNQCLKSVGRDNPKTPPERTLETLAGLGFAFVTGIRADSRRSRAPSDLSFC